MLVVSWLECMVVCVGWFGLVYLWNTVNDVLLLVFGLCCLLILIRLIVLVVLIFVFLLLC